MGRLPGTCLFAFVQLAEIHEPLALHKVVKNHEIEDLKDSLQRGGGVVARKTVGEFLGRATAMLQSLGSRIDVFFCIPMMLGFRSLIHWESPLKPTQVSEGFSHCGAGLSL